MVRNTSRRPTKRNWQTGKRGRGSPARSPAVDLPNRRYRELEPTLAQLAAQEAELDKAENLLADAGILQRQQCEGESEGTDHPVSIHASGTSPYPAGGTTDADPPATDDPVTQMRYRLGTEAGRALYAKRKSTIEPTFGIIKHVLGFRQFLLRGLDQVEGEWDLVCIGFDLKRRFELTA